MSINQIQETVDAASAEAKRYRAQLTTELVKMDSNIDELALNVKRASAEVQAEYETRLQELKVQRQSIERQLEHVQQASEAALEDVRIGLDAMWQNFVTTYERVTAEFDERRS